MQFFLPLALQNPLISKVSQVNPSFFPSTLSEFVSCICTRIMFFGHSLHSILGSPGLLKGFGVIYLSQAPSGCCVGTGLQGIELEQEDRQGTTQHLGEGGQGLDLGNCHRDENVYGFELNFCSKYKDVPEGTYLLIQFCPETSLSLLLSSPESSIRPGRKL